MRQTKAGEGGIEAEDVKAANLEPWFSIREATEAPSHRGTEAAFAHYFIGGTRHPNFGGSDSRKPFRLRDRGWPARTRCHPDSGSFGFPTRFELGKLLPRVHIRRIPDTVARHLHDEFPPLP